LRISPDDLQDFLGWCRNGLFHGLSVTIPHKETVLPLLSRAESAAQGIGAVNTIVINGEEMIGYNTDYRAAMDCLTDAMKQMTDSDDPFRGRIVLILGAGGVARAIGYGLRQRGAVVYISSRTAERSEALAQSIGGRALQWKDRYSITPGLLINGTPIGMFPEMDATPFDATKLHADTLVFDTIYNPDSTLLVKQARQQKCLVLVGSYMFIRQASYQYKLFTGLEPPVDIMRAVLRRAISPVNYNLETDPQSDTGEHEASK
jgi:3-dehydroquinate dehydratase/shikimate dehydrogenase